MRSFYHHRAKPSPSLIKAIVLENVSDVFLTSLTSSFTEGNTHRISVLLDEKRARASRVRLDARTVVSGSGEGSA